MKGVLQSIKPMYCFGIAYGIKTPVPVPNSNKEYEVRKTKPKIPTPFKAYTYCCKSDGDGCIPAGLPREWLGKIVFEYICNEIIEIIADDFNYGHYDISDDDLAKTHLTQEQLWEYGKGKTLYLWHISDLVIYNEPKELNDFAKANFPTFDEMNDDGSLCQYCPATNFGQNFVNGVPDDFQCDFDCYDAYEDYAAQNRFLTRPPQSWCYVEVNNG